MIREVKGACLCGASKYQAKRDVLFTLKCCCKDCQKFTGGAHMLQVCVPKEGFFITGPVKTHRRQSENGFGQGYSFCSDCGSPLFKSSARAPHVVFVTAGSMENFDGLPFDTVIFPPVAPSAPPEVPDVAAELTIG